MDYIYPCDLTLYGECPKDKWGCGHDCTKCQPTVVLDESDEEVDE